MKDNKQLIPQLTLDVKTDIPFPEAQLNIHQPSITEISFIGEADFLTGVYALSKDYKKGQDHSDLSNISNFDILMSVVGEKTENSKKIAENILKILFLIFPDYDVGFTPRAIIFRPINKDADKQTILMIDSSNFDIFQRLIYEMFCLQELSSDYSDDYNPMGDRARAIAEKFKKKHELLAELRKERGEDPSKMSVFGRYINILAVGEHKDKNVLREYSVYQLTEEFKRFQLKETFDFTFQAKMAGATKIKDAKDWTANITFGKEEKE